MRQVLLPETMDFSGSCCIRSRDSTLVVNLSDLVLAPCQGCKEGLVRTILGKVLFFFFCSYHWIILFDIALFFYHEKVNISFLFPPNTTQDFILVFIVFLSQYGFSVLKILTYFISPRTQSILCFVTHLCTSSSILAFLRWVNSTTKCIKDGNISFLLINQKVFFS